ncbi:Acetyl/propionyl-CoA carboxylase, alpha subunit [Raineyella antarctica]|uniref:biotin carboxylase n=2 Tax=Raineyella antarctica TaxID=1577474 RepID=A0A1G6GFD0_9ACTN|nr:Acetyl/propionyl-CoA carboxylase, alpha subunit [Raineyella antarctica]
MRLIHAVRDLNAQRTSAGQAPIRTIALSTDVDAGAAFVREADENYRIGAAADRPYLDLAVLERALDETRADAVWVGWGFVAEDPAFADLCERRGITFIGPSAEAMRKLGDKIGSKLIAEEAGVPVAPWSRGPVDTLEQALAVSEQVGYPLMLKATAGGGGRGIRKVTGPEDLVEAYQRTRDEAMRSFGSGVVFLEKLITGARHIEVQLIADGQGSAWAVGVRDCSVQRRNQKVIEESASPLLEPEQSEQLKASAERLALAVGYCGAATVEFLYHPQTRTFAFLEVNTRLQVEHPVTELVTGLDLVALQIQVASGIPLAGPRPVEHGHAIEARLNAEDADRSFSPSPGRIVRLEFPAGPGVRVDTGVTEGDTIPADFDSMVAKIIAYGSNRNEAIARLQRAMLETTVVIDGGVTNKSFVLELLDRPEVTRGEPAWADTGWIDRTMADGGLVTDRHAGIALVAAAIQSYTEEEQAEIGHLLTTARGGRPQLHHESIRAVELKLRGVRYAVTVARTSHDRHLVSISDPAADPAAPDVSVVARLDRIDGVRARLVIGDHDYRLVTAASGTTQLVEVNGVAHRITRDEGGMMRSPTPALVVGTPVPVGTEVAAGATVVVLEAMKMEMAVTAPVAGRVKELFVRVGTQVATGEPLAQLEPTGDPNAAAEQVAGKALAWPADEVADLDAAGRAAHALQVLRALLLGYDIAPGRVGALLSDYLAGRDALAASGVDVLAQEIGLVTVFTDLAELTRNRPADEELRTELRVHSAREYFHTYLRTLDPERGGLPTHFRDKLLRVLGHYGVTDLERGPELEEAVFRIFLTLHNSADVDVMVGVLQRWLGLPLPVAEADAPAARALLERVIRATQRRFPVVADLARSVRFGWFDQPIVDAERTKVLSGVAEEVAALADPTATDRQQRIEALAAIPEPLADFLRDRLAAGTPEHEPLLEVLVRQNYLDYGLADLAVVQHDVPGTDRHRPVVRAEFDSSRHGTTRIVSTVGDIAELAPGGAIDALVSSELATDHGSVAELYLRWPQPPADQDQVSAEIARLLTGQPFVGACRRVSVAVCPEGDRPVDYYTFQHSPEDREVLVEDRLVRGMHPLVGRRLNLWRLREFDVTRIDVPGDVLLYECVARSNPSDRRLVAAAQVRQLAVVRDEEGRIVGLPHAERAVENCLEVIRRARTARGKAGSQLAMNHVWVTVWPALRGDLEQVAALRDKITPLSDGNGIEEVLAQGRVVDQRGDLHPVAIRFRARPHGGTAADLIDPPTEPLAPLDDYATKVKRAQRRGLVYPYELASVLTRGGSLVEYDLDENGVLGPVERPRGRNTAGMIVALVSTPTELYPEGVRRVVLCGDPTKSLGALSEPECVRVIAALDLAEELGLPLEWYAVSSGARVSMTSGTENMDWVAEALKRIVEFTQDGGEINVVVAGINVGAQPYWNAEATMLMHTKGILVMTPDSAMVLTGKQALDFSGGVSAEDNFGIGGYDRVMGPNGQAQYWAADLAGALDIVLAHYEYSYIAPGEPGPRRAPTTDPADRDVSPFPHPNGDFHTVGEIFSADHNPDRKRPFDIRTVMRAVADADHPMLERWAGMADAETAVVTDTRINGHAVSLIGIESTPVPRQGFPPTDGPDTYTAGTLFPRSSKKVARALNAASGHRPVVVLANLSGFDGSPESMRNLQLEYGAEIGRAIVNFDGPIVFCVISRYHGGAFVVFSKRLNPSLTVLAVEGSYASVLGGAPAAAVVFASEVGKRVAADPRVVELEKRIATSPEDRRGALAVQLADLNAVVRAEKISELASEFDAVHSIHRAVEVGSVDEVIAAADIRPRIIAAIERGLA